MPPPSLYQRFKAAVHRMEQEALALHFAMHDPQVGWAARTFAIIALTYALSPLDLIPDFIPVVGLLDDLLILSALLFLAVYLIPAPVMEHARRRAASEQLQLGSSLGMAVVIIACWNMLILWLVYLALRHWGSHALGAAPGLWIVLGCLATALVAAEVVWLLLRLQKERRRDELRAVMFAGAGGDPLLEQLIEVDGRNPEDP